MRTEYVDQVGYRFWPGEAVYRVGRYGPAGAYAALGPERIEKLNIAITPRSTSRVYALVDAAAFHHVAPEADLFRTEEAAVAEAFLRNEKEGRNA